MSDAPEMTASRLSRAKQVGERRIKLAGSFRIAGDSTAGAEPGGRAIAPTPKPQPGGTDDGHAGTCTRSGKRDRFAVPFAIASLVALDAASSRGPGAARRRQGIKLSGPHVDNCARAPGLESMKSTCVLASAGLPAPPDRHCCCPACAHQAVADALVLMQTDRASAARRVLEALEEDLSQAAALTRRWAPSSRTSPLGSRVEPMWRGLAAR
jgi:hypothetical protein